MNGTKRAQSSAVWTTPECPFAIKYAELVLEDIRLATVSAFHGLAHGGLEIGGILIGSQSPDRVSITDFRMLECEHAFGPSFRLSETDHDRLTATIAGAQAAGETVVGWFHSHTRTELFLSEADLEIYNRYFKDLRQVALVLKPNLLEPMLCGFFFREPDGSIHSEKSYHEFALEGLNKNAVSERVAAPEHDTQRVNVADVPQARRRPKGDEELPQTSKELGAGLPAVDVRQGGEAAVPAPAAQVPQPPESPGQGQILKKSGPWYGNLVRAVAGIVILIGIALGVAYISIWRPGTDVRAAQGQPAAGSTSAAGQALGLKLVRQGADLSLTWNRNLPDVLGASAGLLIIKDGTVRKEKNLSTEQLRSANILFSPESDNVEVQLTLLLPNKRTVRDSAIAILAAQGTPTPATTNPAVQSANAPSSSSAAQVTPRTPNVDPRGVLAGRRQPNQAVVKQPLDKPAVLKLLQSNPPSRYSQTQPSASLSPHPAAAGVRLPVSTAQALPDLPPTPNRDGGNTKSPVLIWRKNPIYPPAARASNLQGVVALDCLIGTDGHVKSLKVISGLAIFRQAALDAVGQWMYRPTKVNGESVEAPTRVEILFREDM